MSSLLKSDRYTRTDDLHDMFRVTQHDVPDMSVHVNQGTVLHDNQVVNFDEQDSEPLAAPTLGTWLVVLSVNSAGQLVYTYGVQSVDAPAIPKLPDECLHLAIIRIDATAECVVAEDIHDLRQVYGFSNNGGEMCQCRCAAMDNALTDDDRAQLKEYMDQYAVVLEEMSRLRALHEPQRGLRILSDGGLLYELRLHDDGTVYTVRVADDEANAEVDPNDGRVLNYRFSLSRTILNVVTHHATDYVPMVFQIRSLDALNDDVLCDLSVRCRGTRIYGEDFTPQYQDDEFIAKELALTKVGATVRFQLSFADQGDHTLRLQLVDRATGGVIDSASALIRVIFKGGACTCGCTSD